MAYQVKFTTDAEQQKLNIPIDRRAAFDKGLMELLLSPGTPPSFKVSDNVWEARVTQWITIRYMFDAGILVVVVIEVRDGKDVQPYYFEN